MKKLTLLGLLLSSMSVATPSIPTIAVTKIVSHPALDDVEKGIREGLKGYNIKLIFENAHGNVGTALQISHKFKGLSPTIVIGISTPSAQALANSFKNTSTPILFAAVSDPITANLVKNPQQPEGWITGTSDFPPQKEQLDLIRVLFPKAKTIGILYNPGEANSVSQVRSFEKLAAGFKVIKGPITGSSDIFNTAKSLFPKADVIYIPADNLIASAFEALAILAIQYHKPLIPSYTTALEQGGLATIGGNYIEEGQELAKIVIELLKGKKPSQLPVRSQGTPKLYLNEGTAKKIGVRFPSSLTKKAFQIFKGAS